MIAISKEQDEWIRLEIHKLNLDQRPFPAVLLDIDALEGQIIESIAAEEYACDLLNVRRVPARLRLVKAVQLSAEATLAKKLFDHAVELGFSHSEDGVVAAALLSRACLARGRADVLDDELEQALKQANGEPDPSYVKLAAEIRRARGAG